MKKLALVAAVSTASSGAIADLQMLDEESLQDVTGQAGLTIDVESQWEIGEFAYQDAGAQSGVSGQFAVGGMDVMGC